ncbi:zinc knuckle CX2CX4HX4C containing protein [Tanacetum coccineum]
MDGNGEGNVGQLDARIQRLKGQDAGNAGVSQHRTPMRILQNLNLESLGHENTQGASAGDEPARTSHGGKTTVVTGRGSNITGMFGPIPSKSTDMFGNTSSITTEVTSDSLFTSSLNEEGLPQSPLVSPTTPLPLHQSNVDVAATFGVLFSMVVDLEVLITDIDAGKYEELLYGMTNDTCKVVIDALGTMCDLIKAESVSRPGFESDGIMNESSVLVTMHTSSHVEEVLIHSIDDVAALFAVSLNSLKDIDEFTKDLEVGKCDLCAPTVDDNLFGEASPSDTIVQSLDINTKSTSYVGAAGASVKDQPKVNSNFRHLVADPVFDGVNISIPRKVVEKVSKCFEHTLYGYFIGKRMAFPDVEYYAKNNWAKHVLKKIMMNIKGFFFFKFNSQAGLEAVLEGGPWLIRNSLIILKKLSMDTRLLKEELTRIPIWVKLHDVPI